MPIQLPDYLRPPETSLAEQTLGNLGSGAVAHVSIEGGRFKLVDAVGDEEPITTLDPKTGIPYMDCCIVDAGPNHSQVFWGAGKSYDPANKAPPLCWSDNGIGPSINAGEPQARTCSPDPTGQHGCKWSVWGSATSKISGKGVPACGKLQKLALAFVGDDVVFLLRVPPNSLENLRTYLAKFRGSGVDVTQVITRISFEKDVLGTLTFMAPGQFISREMEAFRRKVMEAKGTDALVGRLDRPIANLLAAPSPGSTPAQQSAQQSAQPALPNSSSLPAGAPGTISGESAPLRVAGPEPASSGRRRGRPPKPEAAPAGTPAPFAPSLQPNGGFGIQEPAAPDAELESSLKSVFG